MNVKQAAIQEAIVRTDSLNEEKENKLISILDASFKDDGSFLIWDEDEYHELEESLLKGKQHKELLSMLFAKVSNLTHCE